MQKENKSTKKEWAQNIIGISIIVAFVVYAGIYRGCFDNPSLPQECWCDYGYGGFRCDCDKFCEDLEVKCND